MIFRKLTLRNFGPYYGKCELPLRSNDSNVERPICLVGALNGSGKTTFLDAILLALYGARARCSTRGTESYATFLRESVNRRVSPKDGAEVCLELEYRSANQLVVLEIKRDWKAVGSRIQEKLIVFRNGEKDSALAETWAEHVEGLIPLGISNLFFFDGEQVRELATTNDTPQSVRDAIRTLLGLEIPRKLQEDLRIVANRRRKATIKPIGLSEVEILEQKNEELTEERRRVELLLTEQQQALSLADKALSEENEDFVAQGGELAQQRQGLEQELVALKARRQAARDAFREVASGPLPLLLAPDLVRSALARAKSECKSASGARNKALFESRDSRLLTFLSAVPGTEEDLIERVDEFLSSDRAELNRPLNPAPYLGVGDEQLAIFEYCVRSTLPEGLRQSKELEATLVELEHALSRVEAKIEKSAPPEMLEVRLEKLHIARDRVRAVTAKLEDLTLRKLDVCNQLEQGVETRDRLLKRLADEHGAFTDNSRVVLAAENMDKVLEAYQQRLLSRKLHKLEHLVAERFRHLSRKSGFVETVEIDSTSFALSLFDDEGVPVDKKRMSAGEQQLLAISFLWALAIASGRNLPVVIDTPLSRMDSNHRDKLVERYFPHASHQVVLLSTDVEIDRPYFEKLSKMESINKSYRLNYNGKNRSTEVQQGYFW